MRRYGLVFAGGGVRGAYHIGVWKALDELGIEICAACGTSIGAINAALYVNGDFEVANRLWSNITLKDIVRLPDEIADSKNLFGVKNLLKLARKIKEQGLEMTPLEELLRKYLDEDKIRKSKIDFGLATYSLTDKKEALLYKEDIPKGSLIPYLMASACLPGFKSVEVGANRFRDGALANNMPMDMLIRKGIRDIIAVDVKGVGVYKDFNTAGMNVISIECKKPYMGTMEFDSDGIKKSIKEGYLETLRTFGRISGSECYIENESYIGAKRFYSAELIDGIQSAAALMGLDTLCIWDFEELKDAVIDAYCKTELINEIEAMLSEKRIDASHITRLKSDSQRLCLFTRLLETDGFDFIKSRLDKLLGDYYRAASAIIYFKTITGWTE